MGLGLPGPGRKKVGLALGGGAARGLAHVGVINVLEREGVPIDCIAGSSAGSLVGAAYAAGVRGERLVDLALRARWRRLARPIVPVRGLVSFEPMESYLERTIGDLCFEHLQIPFAAIATDLLTGRPVVLREGRVARAVRASSSVPGIVSPAEIDGRLLIDGGVSNNLPISVARALGADVVIAVRLTGPLGARPRNWIQVLVAAVDYWLDGAGDDASTAEVCITLPMPGLLSLLCLGRAGERLVLGRRMAEQALPDVKALLA